MQRLKDRTWAIIGAIAIIIMGCSSPTAPVQPQRDLADPPKIEQPQRPHQYPIHCDSIDRP